MTGANKDLLTISDNGIGIPDHADKKRTGSLGLSLMAGLSEDLDGYFSIENNNGTKIEISFGLVQVVKLQDLVAASLAQNNQGLIKNERTIA